jgi:Flp pilus assembly protein TadG
MSRASVDSPRNRKCGQALVEFALCAVVAVALLLAVVEFGMFGLALATVNNGARIGVRYAMVHGSDNPTTVANIQTVVNNYLHAGAIDTANATVTVSYPGYTALGCAVLAPTHPGCPVKVQVSYPYEVLVSYFPLSITLSAQAEGVITF